MNNRRMLQRLMTSYLNYLCQILALHSCDDGWTAGQTLYVSLDETAAAAVAAAPPLFAGAAAASLNAEGKQQRKYIDPAASKAEPAVAAALLRANVTVDLSGVLEAEHAFWDSWNVQVCTAVLHHTLLAVVV
jgi:hypothetical protein